MMKHKGYELHYYERHKRYQPFKARPYDDADYFYALSADCKTWDVRYKGRLVCKRNGNFRAIVDYLELLNKDIAPKPCHW